MIKAVFKGEDGSRGFRRGKEYDLRTEFATMNRKPVIFVETVERDKFNVYGSVDAFLRNWEPKKVY